MHADRREGLLLQSRDAVIDDAQVLVDQPDRQADIERLADSGLQLIPQSLPMLTHLIEGLAILQAYKGVDN